jgi:hypothetical protein
MCSVTKGKLGQLSHLQDPAYGIPGDVTFQISGPGEELAEDMAVLGELKGHKVILGAFSPVFKSMFFGPLKETKDVIPIEQTTFEAFEKIIDYIYQKDIDWSGMTVLEMYDIVNLAEMYQMPDMMEEIKAQMENVAITEESLMDTAHTAAQFSQFSEVSTTLLRTCARFLQKTKKTSTERLDFAMKQSGNGQEATALQLLVLARDLPALECGNCGEPKEKCLDGKVVASRDRFSPGLKIRVNRNCIYWGENGGGFVGKVYTVISKATTENVVKVQEAGYDPMDYYIIHFKTKILTFCYSCC